MIDELIEEATVKIRDAVEVAERSEALIEGSLQDNFLPHLSQTLVDIDELVSFTETIVDKLEEAGWRLEEADADQEVLDEISIEHNSWPDYEEAANNLAAAIRVYQESLDNFTDNRNATQENDLQGILEVLTGMGDSMNMNRGGDHENR